MNKRYPIAAALGVLFPLARLYQPQVRRNFPPRRLLRRRRVLLRLALQLAIRVELRLAPLARRLAHRLAGIRVRKFITTSPWARSIEREYETSNRSEDATQAIEFYKKAYALDSSSGAIGEQLAEMYFVAQRIRDAVVEAQGVIRRDPSNLPARRLLARIYIRITRRLDQRRGPENTVAQASCAVAGDRAPGSNRYRIVSVAGAARSADQRRMTMPSSVLRDVLTRDSENESAVEQLTQLLIDEGKLEPAVALLQQTSAARAQRHFVRPTWRRLHTDARSRPMPNKPTGTRPKWIPIRPATFGAWHSRFSMKGSIRMPWSSIRSSFS